MFRSPSPEPAAVDEAGTRVPADDLIPLSHLALDLGGVPETGWPAYLGVRAIAFQPDDLGRNSVSRHDARLLLDERRADELRMAAFRARQEQEAVEADQRFRASLPHGIPAGAIPAGSSGAELMLAAARADQPRRRSVTEDALDRAGMTFHSYQETEAS